jgi:hypothetical protein
VIKDAKRLLQHNPGADSCTAQNSRLFDHLVGARPTVIAFRDRQTSTAMRRGVVLLQVLFFIL